MAEELQYGLWPEFGKQMGTLIPGVSDIPVEEQPISPGGVSVTVAEPTKTQVPGGASVTVGEPATPVITIDSGIADKATQDNFAYLNEQITGIEQQALKIQEALKSGQVTGLNLDPRDKVEIGEIYEQYGTFFQKGDFSKGEFDKQVEKPTLTSEEITALGGEITTPVETPEQKLIKEQKAISDALAADLKSVNEELELYKANQDAITQNAIVKIQDTYKAQVELQKELNRRAEEITRTIGIRFGTERYAPQLAGDILLAQGRASARELAVLEAKRDELIMEAQRAKSDKDWEVLDEKIKGIKDAKKESDKVLLELRKEQLKKSEELDKKLQTARDESSVIALYQAGITTAIGIYDALKEQVPIETIDKILNAIVEKKTVTDLDRIKKINEFLAPMTIEEVGATASNYIKAQQLWIAEGGTIAEFKGAFPPETTVAKDELAKLPESIYKPPTEEKATNEDRISQVGKFIESKKGDDDLISWETYVNAKNQWMEMNGSLSTFKEVFNPELLMDEGNLAKLPAGLRLAEPAPSKWETEGVVWKWLETDEAKALSDDEKISQIRLFGLDPETFGIY